MATHRPAGIPCCHVDLSNSYSRVQGSMPQVCPRCCQPHQRMHAPPAKSEKPARAGAQQPLVCAAPSPYFLSVQAVQGYLLLSGLVGGAVTYYYDDDRNVKLQKLLRAGLMLIGLGLVYWSTSMTEASLVLCGLLMLSVPLNMLLQRR